MKESVLQKILEIKAVAVVRLNSDKNVDGMTKALIDGGIPIIEITLTTPGALKIIENLNKTFGDEIIVGAGSVLTKESANDCLNAGAKYLVSPIFREEIISAGIAGNVPVMCGAFTPTEIYSAQQAGADVVKVFPADVLGPKYFKSVLAPMPHLKLMPTGGVNLDNPGEWLNAGAVAVGVGSALVNKNAIESGDFEIIKNNALRIINSIKSR